MDKVADLRADIEAIVEQAIVDCTFGESEAASEIIDLATRALAPVVKPLEWEATDVCGDMVPGENDCEWQAQPHGSDFTWPYVISWLGGDQFYCETPYDGSVKFRCETLTESKAAAQADYERRILSALSLAEND